MRGFHHKMHRGHDHGERHGGGREFLRAAFAHWAGRDGSGFGGEFGRGFGGRGFGGGFGGGGGRGGPGHGRRRLLHGDQLQLLLLALIAEQPRHGYDLIREIEARSGGVYAPSPGMIYPTLSLLDEIGHVEELKEEGARRRFAITTEGRKLLESKQAEAEALLARLAEMASARNDNAPVRRAMMNLHMALREALGRDEEGNKAHRIAELLDETTRKIEQL